MQAIFYQGDPQMVDYTPGSAVTSGDVIVQGNFPTVAHRDIAASALGAVAVAFGIYQIPADAGTVIAFGDVYWDNTAKKVTLTQAGNTHFGVSLTTTVNSGDLATCLHLPNSALVSLLAQPNALNTALTTVGAGVLTAAALVGRIVTRTGPVAAFSDTTDTALLIVAALPSVIPGQSFRVTIKNTTAFAQTLIGGVGVTLSGQTIIPPNSVGEFLVGITSATAVTCRGLFISPMTTPPIIAQGTLVTVGAGTILAATIAGAQLLRTGSTAGFTDTTDTAALIAAAIPNLNIGQSFVWSYQNSTYAVATLTGGTGVNAAATFGSVGPGSWAAYLFTYTAVNTFTVVPVGAGDNWIGLPSTSYSTGTTLTTFTAAQMTGGKLTIYTSTAVTPGSIATPTATAMFAAIQGAYVGLKWIFRVINDAATNSLTVTADASVTLSGKTTYVATPFGSMDFEMTFTSATAATMKYIGGGQSTTV